MITDDTAAIEFGCECVCSCHADGSERAPVFLLIVREGREMRVCSRCDLSSDSRVARLYTPHMPMQPFMDFDPLGAICMAGDRYLDLPVEATYRQQLIKA